MSKALTVEQKLQRAEAKAEFWQGETNKIAVELAEARRSFEMVEREIVDVRAVARTEVEAIDLAGKEWKALAEKRKDENNALRGIILDLQLTVARQNGYLDGVEDAKPPRMVEEHRPSHRFASEPSSDLFTPSPRDRYSTGPTKKWFEQ